MADKKSENYPQLPSAPNGGQQFQPDPSLYHRPPPPTYEESQRWNPQPMYPSQGGNNFYPAMSGNPPPYAGVQQPMQYTQPQLQGMVGYAPNHQQQYAFNYHAQSQMSGVGMAPQQMLPNNMAAMNINQYPTVTFDAGARFTGQGAGSVSIPPPPPGCAPTPEQLAALQGQPVILKKKKNSFF